MFESLAYAQNTAPQQPEGPAAVIISLMPMLLVFLVFYFLLIRPQQKKQKELSSMLSSLKKNDEVLTSSGIHGTIVNVKDDTVVLKVDDNVKIEFEKSAIALVKKSRT